MRITLSDTDRFVLFSELATLLSSGIPILEAVDSLAQDSKGGRLAVLRTLRIDLMEGKTISASFAKYPDAFNPIIINLLKAAEGSGTLEKTLLDITATIQDEMEFRGKIRAALAYPATIFIVFLGVILIILLYVIPRIAMVFSRLNVTLPLPTHLLISLSSMLTGYTLYVIVGFIAYVGVSVWMYLSNKQEFVAIFLSLPFISTVTKDIDRTRFCHTLEIVLSAGIPIVDALGLCEQIVTTRQMREAIREATEAVRVGKKLSDGLKKANDSIPATMLRMLEAGEKSGTLEKALADSGKYYAARVNATLKTITTLIEPILLVVVGVLVGGMMLAIVAPIYTLIGQINAR